MKRRDFLKMGVRKAAEVVYKAVDAGAELRAYSWFRPPFAVAEMDFLPDCTRCDECIAACEHEVLFKLPVRYGVEVAGTPALDLLNKGCHLCVDWPCVTVCDPGVLVLPDHDEGDEVEPPKLAVVSIVEDTCLPFSGPECGACASSCPVPGALTWQGGVKPIIDEGLCTGCALCRESCITAPKSIDIAVFIHPVERNDGESNAPV